MREALADDAIDVSVRIQDESGKPIPYVAVWRAIEFDKKHIKDDRGSGYLSVDDLWRVTQHYGELHDIICQVGDKPVAGLWVSTMANGDGVFHEALNYAEALGEETQPRPASLTFGYTFMKRGYLPGRVVFTTPKNSRRVEATVTLKRNPGEALETQAYLETFARLRYELSDIQRNTLLTEENRRRLVALAEQMEQAAQQAQAAGDKAAAARIYSRMRYLPSLQVVDGRITGWNQGDPASRQARRAMEKAYELDPDNLYVWIQTYQRRRALLPNPTTEERIAATLREVELLIAAKGDAVWPQCFLDQAAAHALLGHFETAYRLYREAARREPSYMDWNAEIAKLKTEMTNNGVPIPAD
jgi:hypothetical protein